MASELLVRPTDPAVMARRKKTISKSLRDLGEIQVTEWELPEFMTKEISELEVSRAVQRLGGVRVTDWELKEVVPTLQRLAHREVDIVGLLKRAADYKINDWDIRQALLKSRAKQKQLTKGELKLLGDRLSSFLRYMVEQLVEEPEHSSVLVDEMAPQVLRCRVILKQRDLSMLIGMNGMNATPLRRIVKDVALSEGAYCLLQIQTHEEAASADS